MNKMGLELNKIFDKAFDTFKAFDNLNIFQASDTFENTPKSIWQILNHLIVWQAYQIALIQGKLTSQISEAESWVMGREVKNQNALTAAVNIFNTQIEVIKNELGQLLPESELITNRIRLFQELAAHLSFHLGEVILIRRQHLNYPMPHEMHAFLSA